MNVASLPLSPRALVRLGVLAVALLGAITLAVGPATATDHQSPTTIYEWGTDNSILEVDRLAGPDRYGTAAAVSAEAYPEGADAAVVATGLVFADALGGAGLAAALDAPILLTRPGSVPTATAIELNRLGVDDIYLLGETAAVSAAVEAELQQIAAVTRIGGSDRYETASLVAERISDEFDRLFIASGANFPDAIAGGAAAGVEGSTVLLTRPGSLPDVVAEALEDFEPEEIIILGGPAAVSAGVAGELSSYADIVTRMGGANRYDTARIIARHFFGEGPDTFLASGEDFADALAVAPLAAATDAPVILTRSDRTPFHSRLAFNFRGADFVTVVGGTRAVMSDAVTGLIADDEVVFFGDTHLHGNYGDDDGPNLARYSQLVSDRRVGYNNSLFVGGGDEIAPAIHSGVDFGQYHGVHMIDALNISELDVTTMGNHDFDFGPSNTREVIANSDFQWVSANVRDTEDTDQVFGAEQGAELYVTYEFGDVTVGVTGLGPQGMETITNMTVDGVGAVRIDTDDALDEAVGMMEDDGVDFVVIASHYCGTDALDLADNRDDIDLIIGDHCADVLDWPEFRGPNDTAVVLVGDEYDHLAELSVLFTDGEHFAYTWHRHDLDETYPEDPAIRQLIDEYEELLDEAFDEIIGFRETEWDVRSPDPVRQRETPFANYIADTIRMEADAEIVIQNGGGIRSDMIYGANEDIILRDVVSILPFANHIASFDLDGEHVRAALEWGVGNLPGDGRFPHVSGLRYEFDPTADPGDRILDVEFWDEDQEDWVPLDDDRTYVVATNDFMFEGGDGYDMFVAHRGDVHIGHGDGRLLSVAVADRIRTEETITVELDGRIVRTDENGND